MITNIYRAAYTGAYNNNNETPSDRTHTGGRVSL